MIDKPLNRTGPQAPESDADRSGQRSPSAQARRRFRWRVEAFGVDLLRFLVRLMPLDTASALGGRLARSIGPRTKRHRIAELNIQLAFPDLAEAERRQVAMGFWDNFGRSAIEFMLMDRLTRDPGRIEVVGAERMYELARSKTPAVLISGHFANFEVMMAAILQFGAPARVVYRPANNPYVNTRINAARRSYGVSEFAAKGGNTREVLKTLKSGGWLAVLTDQRDDDGAEAPLFGHPVKVATGPVRLALSFGGRFIPVAVVRTGGAYFRVIFHEPVELARSGDTARDVAAGAAQVNAFLEGVVRDNPAQWLWSHRRWPLEVYGALNRKHRI